VAVEDFFVERLAHGVLFWYPKLVLFGIP
jgi:hypothetical protein